MDTYEAEDPNDRNRKITRTQLNLLCRMLLLPPLVFSPAILLGQRLTKRYIGNFEALARPQRSVQSEPEHVGDEGNAAVASA
jgi:hypothetical protein